MADRTRHFSVFFAAAGVKAETVWRPAVDIYRTANGWVVKFELAGVRPEDVEVLVKGCRVTVRGVRKDYFAEEGWLHQAMEIAYNRFERTVELPCESERAHWSVDYKDGILIVRLENR